MVKRVSSTHFGMVSTQSAPQVLLAYVGPGDRSGGSLKRRGRQPGRTWTRLLK
jgi:hypothetical protein